VTHSFVLHSLGAPALFTVAGEQVRFRTRKHFALLIRLALEPGKQFTRDYLADLLWPEAAPKLANHSLAQGLSVIKAKIAHEAVIIQRSTVGLAPAWIDVDATHLTAGVVSIDGPFLDGFEIPAARPFEDWKDEHRARLVPQLRDCLVRQMDAARRIGDFPTVERHAARLQELDPLAEQGIRGIMEARAWASDRSGALKAFARYESQLAEELGAKPGPELVRMADLLRDGRRSPTRPVTPGYPPERADRRFEPETLIGREREFSVLFDAWLEARRKSPRIVVVTSDPGVGKTTLVNAFASSCQMEGAVVARAQAYDAERELPFAVLGELVKQLATQRAIGSADPEALSELTRISSEILKAFPGVPKPVDWSPELMPLRIADAFLKTLMAAAADSPVMLVIDDIHAADGASIAILHSVVRKLCETCVLVILTGRMSELRLSGAPWALTTDLSISTMQFLALEVLQADSAKRLIDQLAGSNSKPAPPADRILRASGGNPLAIELLTREWAEHGSASLLRDLEALDTQPAPTIGIPRAIGTVFERQTRRLEPAIRAALDLAAVLGRRLTEVGLYAAIDLSPGQAAEALSRLRDEGFLREVSGDLEFRNELIRAQAYYAIASASRLHFHKRVAESLAERPIQKDPRVTLEIAWHLLKGGSGARAVPFAHGAAEAFLSIGAPHEAEEILKALSDSDQDTSTLRHTRLMLVRALLDQSKADSAIPFINKLITDRELSATQQAEVAMFRASAEFLLNSEPGEKYCEVARSALEYSRKSEDLRLIARSLFECARAGTEQGLIELLSLAEEEIEQLREKVDISTLPLAVVAHLLCHLNTDPNGCLRDLLAAEANSPKANAAEMAFLYSGIGLVSINLCRLKDAYDACLRAFELSRRVGDDERMSVLASNLSVIQVARGLYDDGIGWGERGTALGEHARSSALQMAYTNLADAYVLVGREGEAVAAIERAREWLVPKRRWKFHCGFLVVNAAFSLIRGNIGLALDLIGQLEVVSRGKERAIPIPGAYWKLRVYREAHLGSLEEAYRLAQDATKQFRDVSPLHYLDILAAKVWLEIRMNGENRPETLRDLCIFEELGAFGRKELLTAQGFLRPARNSGMVESRSASSRQRISTSSNR